MLRELGYGIEACGQKGIVGITALIADITADNYASIVEIIRKKTKLDLLDPESISKLTEEEVANINSKISSSSEALHDAIDDIITATVCDGKVPEDPRERAQDADATWLERNFLYIYAGYLTLWATIIVTCMIFFQIPKANIRFADTILGFILGSIIAPLVTYFFGASVKSIKSKLTAKAAPSTKGGS